MTTIPIILGENSYNITVGRDILQNAGELFRLDRRVVIITDDGVPSEYAEAVRAKCAEGRIITVPVGEGSKSLDTYGRVLDEIIAFGLTRTDALVAVGGGVVGDLTGFIASTYMRGIDFYNIPTTLLSQVDSSIGGKCAVNHAGVKNIVGAFYQPRGVLIDLSLLKTLNERQISAGLAEALKMAVTFDDALFEKFERLSTEELVCEDMIVSALNIKKGVVEKDERECGLRRALNFGHTFGHAVEAKEEMSGLLHGECVAIGMCYVSARSVKERLIPVLKKLSLPTEYNGDIDGALSLVFHDKKCEGRTVSVILCDEIGSCREEKMSISEFTKMIKDGGLSI